MLERMWVTGLCLAWILFFVAWLLTPTIFALVTAANDAYFDSVVTLIASVHRWGEPFHSIHVFDLGLSAAHQEFLARLKGVQVRQLHPERLAFPEMLHPKGYAWKVPMMMQVSEETAEYVFWLDAGACFVGNPQEAIEILVRDQVFLVEDPEHYNKTWTSLECRRLMQTNEKELNAFQLSAAVSGFRRNGAYHQMYREAERWSGVKGCVWGSHEYASDSHEGQLGIRGHRHDQSILSILSVRHNAPRQPLSRFAQYRSDQLKRAVIYVHRRFFHDDTGLLFTC